MQGEIHLQERKACINSTITALHESMLEQHKIRKLIREVQLSEADELVDYDADVTAQSGQQTC